MHAKLHGRRHERGLFTSDRDTAEKIHLVEFATENIHYSIIIRNWISFFAILSSRVIRLAKCTELKKGRKKSRYRLTLITNRLFFPSYLFARITHVANSNLLHAEVLISQGDLSEKTVDTLNQVLLIHTRVSPLCNGFSKYVLKQ